MVPGWPDGVGRIALQRVDSTMEEAARRAGEIAAPTWIMAAEQTAARGRRGRVWATSRGNFSATLVMRPEGGPSEAALRSFVAALALHDALAAAAGGAAPFTLKWPNDVLMEGRKVAGILLETRADGALLIGVGVNLAAAPDPADLEPAALAPAALADAGAEISPAAFLDLLAPAFADWEGRFATQGFAPIRTAWLARAARLGAAVRARTGHEEIAGTFETLDSAGHLVLATAAGRRTIAAADVFL